MLRSRNPEPRYIRPRADDIAHTVAWMLSEGPTWRRWWIKGRCREIDTTERRGLAENLLTLRALVDKGVVES